MQHLDVFFDEHEFFMNKTIWLILAWIQNRAELAQTNVDKSPKSPEHHYWSSAGNDNMLSESSSMKLLLEVPKHLEYHL